MTARRGSAAAAVTAAFVGPGTVTTCSPAGAGYGVTLLWALTLSLLVLLVAQLQCVRLGAVGRVSLAACIGLAVATALSLWSAAT
jgi:Mn2+/Fe2+ NRAMP family transporter